MPRRRDASARRHSSRVCTGSASQMIRLNCVSASRERPAVRLMTTICHDECQPHTPAQHQHGFQPETRGNMRPWAWAPSLSFAGIACGSDKPASAIGYGAQGAAPRAGRLRRLSGTARSHDRRKRTRIRLKRRCRTRPVARAQIRPDIVASADKKRPVARATTTPTAPRTAPQRAIQQGIKQPVVQRFVQVRSLTRDPRSPIREAVR